MNSAVLSVPSMSFDSRFSNFHGFPSQERPTPDDWENHKDLIVMLYIGFEMTLSKVIEYMRICHRFKASARMYKQRLTAWNVYKYKKVKERSAARAAQTTTTQLEEAITNGFQDASENTFYSPDSTSQTKEHISAAVELNTVQTVDTEILNLVDSASPSVSSPTMTVSSETFSIISIDPDFTPLIIFNARMGNGSVEELLYYAGQFSESWTPADVRSHRPYIIDADFRAARITANVPGHCAHKSSPNQCERCTWSEFDYALAMLEAGQTRPAFQSMNLGCSLAGLLLSNPSKLFIRNLIMAFGSYRWNAHAQTQKSLLQYLADIALLILGENHPIAKIMKCVVVGDVLQASAEFALKIMIKSFEKSMGPAHPDVLLIKRSLSVILRRQGEFEVSEGILTSAVKLSTMQHGSCHKETRRCLRRLAHLYMQRGLLAEADQICHQILATAPANHCASKSDITDEISIYTYHHLVQITRAAGDFDTCRRWFVKELDAAIKKWGPGGEYSADCLRAAFPQYGLTDTMLHDMIDDYPRVLQEAKLSGKGSKILISKARWCAVRNMI